MRSPATRPITLATVLAIAATSPMAYAQSIGAQDPNAPRLTVPAAPVTRPMTPAVQNDASKRSAIPAIPRSGPAALPEKTKTPAVAPKPAAGKLVTDRGGQPISGAVEVGNNRVLDPRTGKIHTTVPTASGAQAID